MQWIFAMQKIRAERVGRICRFLASFSRDNFAMQKKREHDFSVNGHL